MAKSKKPAAKKRGSTGAKKPAAKIAEAKSSASDAATKVSKAATGAAADAKSAATTASKAVSPSAMKKELEASAKPAPAVAKVAPGSYEDRDDVKVKDVVSKDEIKETTTSTLAEKAPAAASAAAPVAQQQEKRSIFLPLVLGGVVAAGLGYAASEFDLLGTRGANTSDELRTSVESQASRLSALEAVEAPEVDLSAVDTLATEVAGTTSRLDELGTEISGMTGRLEELKAGSTELAGKLDGIDARLTDIEKRPITENADSEAAVAAYERELAALQASVEEQRDALQTSVDEQRAEIESLLDNAISVEEAAAETAKVASLQGALTDLTSALNSGQPFGAALATMTEQGVADVPAALSDVAEDGVQTLNALQTRFPDSARASLGAARASGENDSEGGVGGFLRRQLGARSVTPREGSSPDAVLSRAEAAVREGRLDDALTELDTLPAPAQEAMQDWLDDARARSAAQAATQDLSQSLTAN